LKPVKQPSKNWVTKKEAKDINFKAITKTRDAMPILVVMVELTTLDMVTMALEAQQLK